MPKISIVIACHDAGENIFRCLSALEAVSGRPDAEVIVVDNSREGTSEGIAQRFPHTRLIRAPERTLIPHLWELGIQNAAADIVAMTTGDFIPDRNWIEQILIAHQGPYAGIGGAIENEARGGIVSRAIHLCRYSAYMLPLKQVLVKDFAADNASYKRSVLERYTVARRNGFWESAIHAQMIRDGLQLQLTPNIVVYHQKSFSFRGFMQQRFHHGRQYGSDRARSFSAIRRQLYILMSPFIPVIFLWRITRRVVGKKRNFAQYLSALPVLILFLLSWSAGELTGYLRAPNEQDLSAQIANRRT